VDMHRPEKWGYIQFTSAPPGQGVFVPDPAGPAKHLLHRVYYAQRRFLAENKRYAQSLADLGLVEVSHESLAGPIRLETQAYGYQATAEVRLKGGNRQSWRIRQDSLVEEVPAP